MNIAELINQGKLKYKTSSLNNSLKIEQSEEIIDLKQSLSNSQKLQGESHLKFESIPLTTEKHISDIDNLKKYMDEQFLLKDNLIQEIQNQLPVQEQIPQSSTVNGKNKLQYEKILDIKKSYEYLKNIGIIGKENQNSLYQIIQEKLQEIQ